MMSYREKCDWAIAFACQIMRAGLADPGWTPKEVLPPVLPHEGPAERRVRAEIMGVMVQAGHPWAGIRFDAALLARPVRTVDETLRRHYGDLQLAALRVREDDVAHLRRNIARLIVRGEDGIEELAKSVGMSVRTLQRRLNHAGMNFFTLRDEVRKTLALNLMENQTLALGQIAFSVGYAEVGAFNHAVRRWTGLPPGQYRRLGARPSAMLRPEPARSR